MSTRVPPHGDKVTGCACESRDKSRAGLFGRAAANDFLHLPHMRPYHRLIGFGLWDA